MRARWWQDQTWLVGLSLAVVLAVWFHHREATRNAAVSAVGDAAAAETVPTGVRQPLVGQQSLASYEWIMQTEHLLAEGRLTIRTVDYDNAPEGRVTERAAPYRWWLALASRVEALRSDVPPTNAVAAAAAWADPALHVLTLVLGGWWVARRFGGPAAWIMVTGWGLLYPVAGSFVPGQPGSEPLALALAPALVLALATGVSSSRPRAWFAAAGFLGGLGLWIDVSRFGPLLAGVAAGGLVAEVWRRPHAAPRRAWPWMTWSIVGSASSCAAYLLEYLPDHLGAGSLHAVHPVYAVGWLGLGAVVRAGGEGRELRSARFSWWLFAGTVAILTVPLVLVLRDSFGFLAADHGSTRLSRASGAPTAPHLWAWISRDGISLIVLAVLLPLGLLLPMVARLRRPETDRSTAARLWLVLGSLAPVLGLAAFRLSHWGLVQVLLLAGAALAMADRPAMSASRRRLDWGLAACALLPSLALLWPRPAGGELVLSETEARNLVQRDLAHWLAARTSAADTVILAPPALSVAIAYHGGRATVASPYRENYDGLTAAVRIFSATSLNEAQSLIEQRRVTHVVLPSWEPFYDPFVQLQSGPRENSLLTLLQRWLPPRWLRPVPYALPGLPGWEGQSVAVFEVVPVQDDVVALCRLGEYFLEVGRLEHAVMVAGALEQNFPHELDALVTRAAIAAGIGHAADFAAVGSRLLPLIERGQAELLAWDRRVTLAIVLSQARETEAARAEVASLVAEMEVSHLRDVTPGSLYRLLLLARAFNVTPGHPDLLAAAHRLLTPEMIERLR